MKVSALVSAYNSSDFLTDCLRDLLAQTLYKKGELEIIVIDSGSEEKEDTIVNDFQKYYDRIKFLRTKKRETLYQAWNRGIFIAEGEFITNANTDDSHDEECLEILAYELSRNIEFGLVYGNIRKIIESINGKSQESLIKCESQKFFPGSLFIHYPYGAQPMWRKSLHDNVGVFNNEFTAVGDYEFALRLVEAGTRSLYAPEAWGNMRWRQDAISTRDSDAINEKNKLLKKYRNSKSIHLSYQSHFQAFPFLKKDEFLKECYLDLGLRGLCFSPQFSQLNHQTDLSVVKFAYNREENDRRFYNNFLLYNILLGQEIEESTEEKIIDFKCEILMENYYSFSAESPLGQFTLFGSNLHFPTEMELCDSPSPYLKLKEEIEDSEFSKIRLFTFDFTEFWKCQFKNLDFKKLEQCESIYVWGINDRSIMLTTQLNDFIRKKIIFLDSNPSWQKKNVFGKPILAPSEIKNDENECPTAFILAMNSIHWKTIDIKIGESFKNPLIFHLQK